MPFLVVIGAVLRRAACFCGVSGEDGFVLHFELGVDLLLREGRNRNHVGSGDGPSIRWRAEMFRGNWWSLVRHYGRGNRFLITGVRRCLITGFSGSYCNRLNDRVKLS